MKTLTLFNRFNYSRCRGHHHLMMRAADISIPVLSQKKSTVLRELKTDDAHSLYNLIDGNREHLREWLFWVDLTNSEKDSFDFIVNSRQQRRQGNALVLGLFHEERVSGTVSLVSIDRDKNKAELGYWISQHFQGKGLVTNSCLALMGYGFDILGLDEIYARVVTANAKSIGVFSRIGLVCQDQDKEQQYYKGTNLEVDMTKGTMTKENWLKLKELYQSGLSVTLKK